MKKRIKKLMVLILNATMVIGMLAGCGNSNVDKDTSASTYTSVDKVAEDNKNAETGENSAIDTSEHVDIKMYLIGDRSADFDAVYDEVNAILEEKLNCSLSVDFLSWSEHETKYSLLFSGGEDFDLIFTASQWCHYEQTVGLGGFYPLTEEFIQTYAPDAWAILPSMAWSQAKINGDAYMVPYNNADLVSNALVVRGDLMEKIGMTSLSNWDEYKAYNLGCAENGIYGSQGNAWWQFFHENEKYVIGGTPKGGEFFLYSAFDPSDTNVYYALDWEGFTTYCRDMKEMADAGCWSSDILNSTDERQTGLLNGTTASMIWNLGSCRIYGKQADAAHPEWGVTMVDPYADVTKVASSYINGGMGINFNSKNKERAMMVVNELLSNPALQDLTMLGIEGKHWEAVGDDQYKILDASGYPTDNNCNWGWSNDDIYRKEFIEERTALDDNYDSLLASYMTNLKEEHPLDGFSFNTENVTTQCAAVEAALGIHYGPLMNGLVQDVDATIAELKAAMEFAGIQDIHDELLKQIDEYLASK